MDPTIFAAAIKAVGPALTEAVKEPPAPPQPADGYSMGGMLDSRSSNMFSSVGVVTAIDVPSTRSMAATSDSWPPRFARDATSASST